MTVYYEISLNVNEFINHHHHHVMPPARISQNLSRHFSLSFIASGRFSGLHHVSSHSCCMYVRAGRPAFARPYVGVHWSISLMSSLLLLQQCPACLFRLTNSSIEYTYFDIYQPLSARFKIRLLQLVQTSKTNLNKNSIMGIKLKVNPLVFLKF